MRIRDRFNLPSNGSETTPGCTRVCESALLILWSAVKYLCVINAGLLITTHHVVGSQATRIKPHIYILSGLLWRLDLDYGWSLSFY